MTSEISIRERLRPGATIADGKYLLFDQLGEGGMGTVWRAQQTGTAGFAKPVALKLMVATSDQREARILFLNEARISARLHHPNIIEIYDLGQDGDVDYIAMEYLAGMDLQSLLRAFQQTRKALPWPLAAHIIAEASKGLHYAHQRKDEDGTPLALIHRDIKPANILVSFEGYVKVIDFGIAKSAINDGRTKTGMIKGTPAYMAPEQLAASELDRRADLFSLGAVLYELCCGRPAFVGETLYNIIFAIQGQPPQPFTKAQAHLPEALKAIILKCLEKDPEKRYQTARELRFALEGVLTAYEHAIDHETVAEAMAAHKAKGADKGFLPTLSRSLATGAPPLRETDDGLPVASMRSNPGTADNDSLSALQLDLHDGISPHEELDTTDDLQEKADDGDDVFEDEDGTYIDPSPFRHTLDGPGLGDVSHLATQMVRPDQMPLRKQKEKRPTSQLLYLIVGGASAFGVAMLLGMWLVYQSKQPQPSTAANAATSAASSPRRTTPRRAQATTPATPQRRQPSALRPAPTPTAPLRRRKRRLARARRSPERPTKPRPRRPRSSPRRAFRAKEKATIMVDITPRCRLFAGSKALGLADGTAIQLAPGEHSLRCVNYPKRLSRSFHVRLRPGQRWKHKRRYRRGTLFVLSFPAALVFLRAQRQRFGLLGQSHERLSLYEGQYQLILHKKGNPRHKKHLAITIRPGQLTRPKIIW